MFAKAASWKKNREVTQIKVKEKRKQKIRKQPLNVTLLNQKNSLTSICSPKNRWCT